MTNTAIRTGEREASPRLKKCFSVFMALYPILCIYKAFSRFTIGDVILMAFLVIGIFYPIERNRSIPVVCLFAFYGFAAILMNMFLSQGIDYSTSSYMFRLIKFVFYMLCVFVCGKRFFDAKCFQKAILIIGAAASVFIIVQYAVYYAAGVVLLGRVPGLSLYLSEYSDIDYETIYSYSFRPCSFFLEPALFCHFLIVPLILVLFTDNLSKSRRVILAILFTVAMLMSTAGQGILYMAVVYFIYAFRGIKNRGRALIFVLFAVIVAVICYNQIEVVRQSVDRLLFNETASEARLGTYQDVFDMDWTHSLFGNGYGVTPDNQYMAGAAYVWYGCGLIGLVIAFGLFLSFYRQIESEAGKTVCIIFFIMFFGTGLFYNYMLYWYFSLMVSVVDLKKES